VLFVETFQDYPGILMTGWNKRIGRKGEDAAARLLAERGYDVLARNVRTPSGELDLVAVHGEYTVFVEIKARHGRAHGLPEEAVTPAKKARLRAAAQHYLQERNMMETPWRIDVAVVKFDPAGRIQRFEVFENAVSG
jgi:putative endonuclease